MKVLIITYYWPPAGGSGVQRWLKFVKYLQDFGITPIVYTPDTNNFIKQDVSLLEDVPKHIKVLKQPIWQPTDVLSKKASKKEGLQTISNTTNNPFLAFVRGNFFLPDPKVFWVRKSVKFLTTVIKANNIDVVISTGPPHSMHLIAKKLKQNTKVKWLADFRDPWSNLYYNKDLKLLGFAKYITKKLEKQVLQQADCVLTVSDTLKDEFSKHSKNVHVITNGYDDDVLTSKHLPLDTAFSIVYIGLLPKQSMPHNLFAVLQELCKEYKRFKNDLRLQFIGDISNDVKAHLTTHQLLDNSVFLGYVPHKKAIAYQKTAQVLLLLIPNVAKNNGILTGKLFEYITAQRPILALGPKQGDLETILKTTKTGHLFSYDDSKTLKAHILALYKQYKKNTLNVTPVNIAKYHRKMLTKQLATLLKSLH